jgi:hypothetical protein
MVPDAAAAERVGVEVGTDKIRAKWVTIDASHDSSDPAFGFGSGTRVAKRVAWVPRSQNA